MSTKAIREVLSLYAKHAGPGTYGEAIQKSAVEEVEAIEKAAKDMTRIKARLKHLPDVSWSDQEIHDANVADATLESVAMGAP